jgi:hypothetical protein
MNAKEPMKEKVKSKIAQSCIPFKNSRLTFQEIKILRENITMNEKNPGKKT